MLDCARPFCAALLHLISFKLLSSSTLFARRSWSIFRLVSLGGRLGKASSAKQSASKEPQFVKDGFLLFHISASESNRLAVRIEFPMAPRLERSADQGVSAFLGPLLLALDLAEQHRSVHYYGFASSDWKHHGEPALAPGDALGSQADGDQNGQTRREADVQQGLPGTGGGQPQGVGRGGLARGARSTGALESQLPSKSTQGRETQPAPLRLQLHSHRCLSCLVLVRRVECLRKSERVEKEWLCAMKARGSRDPKILFL